MTREGLEKEKRSLNGIPFFAGSLHPLSGDSAIDGEMAARHGNSSGSRDASRARRLEGQLALVSPNKDGPPSTSSLLPAHNSHFTHFAPSFSAKSVRLDAFLRGFFLPISPLLLFLDELRLAGGGWRQRSATLATTSPSRESF